MSKYYLVEQFQDGRWVPKCRTVLEDPSFYAIATHYNFRILYDNVDITDKYREPGASVQMSPEMQMAMQVKPSEPPMKPAAYKALSSTDKQALQQKAVKLKEAKKKRVEILSELNITEATYDTVRADMANPTMAAVAIDSNNTSDPSPIPSTTAPVNKPVPTSPIRRNGLLGRR